METLIEFFKLSANSTTDIAFFRYFFPFIAVVGGFTTLYYGYRGIVKKSTINLAKLQGMSFSQSVNAVGPITGTSAVIAGVFYVLLGMFLIVILGGISYYMWF